MYPATAAYNPPDVEMEQVHRHNEFTTKETILYSILGLAVAGGLFFVGRNLYRNLVSGAEEKRSLDVDSSASYAKRIRMAFDNDGWWGTDEEALRRVLREVQSQQHWQLIAVSYQRLYNTPLMRDMQDELTTTEYAEMTSIIAAKPAREGQQAASTVQLENWARRLKAAFDITNWGFPGTDEDAVKAVFTEIPSQAVFVEVGQAYARLFAANLMEDLKGEMWDYKDYMRLITSKT